MQKMCSVVIISFIRESLAHSLSLVALSYQPSASQVNKWPPLEQTVCVFQIKAKATTTTAEIHCLWSSNSYEITNDFRSLFFAAVFSLHVYIRMPLMKSPKSNQTDEKNKLERMVDESALHNIHPTFCTYFVFYLIFVAFSFVLSRFYSSIEAKIAQQKFTLLLIYKILC